MSLKIANFAGKNAIFNLNESDRMVMSQHPADMRMRKLKTEVRKFNR